MDFLSSSSSPPSSPLRDPSPDLPDLPPLAETQGPRTPLPPFTSDLTDLDITSTVSASEEEQEESEPDRHEASEPNRQESDEDQQSWKTIVAETRHFWRANWRRKFGFRKFLKGWILESSADGRQFRGRVPDLCSVLKDPLVRRKLEDCGVQIQFKGEEPEIGNPAVIRRELIALSKNQPAFGKFNPQRFSLPGNGPCSVREVCSTEWIENALRESWPQLLQQSPNLGAFLTAVLSNQRQHPSKPSRPNAEFPHAKRACMISALLLGAMAPSTSSFLPMSIGIYLHNSGVPRQVIETLASFGVSVSHGRLLDQLKKMSDQSTVGTGPVTTPNLSNDPDEPQTRLPRRKRRLPVQQLHRSRSGSSPRSKRRHVEPDQLSDRG
ncbi:hypothetical protein GGR54DRAFT_610251 [Hypoxylon sp. NC1633]|nr:hypothetical protein GGR54DRAFT_610251 [Hypoxylon sp. NC1633]